MKKIFYFITALCVSALFGCVTASAQSTVPKNPDGLILNKWVEKQSDGSYKLYLDSYVTGSSIQTVSTESKPCDVILVLDNSGSMNSKIKATEIRTDVPIGTKLEIGQEYVAKINGVEYYIKGFSVETYTELPSADYSYDKVNNGKYYYKRTEKGKDYYYRVSGEKEKNKSNYFLITDRNGNDKYIKKGGGLGKQKDAAS